MTTVETGTTKALEPHPQYAVAGDHSANGGMSNRHRRDYGDLEVGVTDVLIRHPTAHLVQDHAKPVPNWKLRFEAARPLWLRECVAEATGVFCYVYCGVSALATLVLTDAQNLTNFGGLLNVAFGFGFGIAFALLTSATTSGGHFNPAITLAFATFEGFPWRKVPRYIISQIFGGFMASLFVYGQWHQGIAEYQLGYEAKGLPLVSTFGPAGIFVAIPTPGQSNGYLFLTEFLTDSFIGLCIWACIDPNNNFMSPVAAPWAIGLIYFTMILGFGANTLATNLARDLGARCMAACFWGREVFTVNNHYPAIAILANIPATFLGVAFYQLNMSDHGALIRKGHAIHPEVHEAIQQEQERRREQGLPDATHKEILQSHASRMSQREDLDAVHEKRM